MFTVHSLEKRFSMVRDSAWKRKSVEKENCWCWDCYCIKFLLSIDISHLPTTTFHSFLSLSLSSLSPPTLSSSTILCCSTILKYDALHYVPLRLTAQDVPSVNRKLFLRKKLIGSWDNLSFRGGYKVLWWLADSDWKNPNSPSRETLCEWADESTIDEDPFKVRDALILKSIVVPRVSIASLFM